MKYVVSPDVYMFEDEAKMYSVQVVSRRELLLHLLDLTEDEFLDEDDKGKQVHHISTEELEKWFNDANGDGQPYVRVFSIEEDKQVLG